MKQLKKIKVSVRKIDIKRGERTNVCRCPIALATKRLAGVREVYAGSRVMTIEYTGEAYSDGLLSVKAQDFIARYDRNEVVKPFSFVMELRGVRI